jgi:murein L,D-transpeptidase YcbB/YkuD
MVKVRQLPGATNSMGTVKFPFANGEGIYLHDTPDKDLFAQAQRTLSNGCVRLEDAPRLARWLMGSDPHAAGPAPEQTVRLPRGVPIYITYLTASPSGGDLTYLDDVYGRDGQGFTKTAALK